MNRSIFLLLFILSAVSVSNMTAQIYASVADKNGETKYWRIVNASEAFADKCITSTSSSSKPFLINNINATDENQKIELKPFSGDTAKYYIRSVESAKYFMNSSTFYNGFQMVNTTAFRSSSTPYTITPIGEGQVLISCVSEDGITLYLNAANESTINERVLLENALDSRYAWYIIDYSADPTAIHPAINIQQPNIKVEGHRIVANSNQPFTIHDLTGRRIPSDRDLTAGIYIVHLTNGENVKVSIR